MRRTESETSPVITHRYTDDIIIGVIEASPEKYPNLLGLKFVKRNRPDDPSILNTEAAQQEALGECFFVAAISSLLHKNPLLINDIIISQNEVEGTATLRAFLPDVKGDYKAHHFILTVSGLAPEQDGARAFHKHHSNIELIAKLYAAVCVHLKLTLPSHGPSNASTSFRDHLHGGRCEDVFKVLFGDCEVLDFYLTQILSDQRKSHISETVGIDYNEITNALDLCASVLVLSHMPDKVQDQQKTQDYINTMTSTIIYFSPEEKQAWIDEMLPLVREQTGTAQKLQNLIAEYMSKYTPYVNLRSRQIDDTLSDTGVISDLNEQSKLRPLLEKLLNRDRTKDQLQLAVPDDLFETPTNIVLPTDAHSHYYELIFNKLKEMTSSGHLVTVSTKKTLALPGGTNLLGHISKRGLVQNHAYTFLGIEKRVTENGKVSYLVLLQNPWRYHVVGYENGKQKAVNQVYYSRASRKANLLSDYGEKIGPPNELPDSTTEEMDGSFHIDLQTFLQNYNHIAICKVDRPIYSMLNAIYRTFKKTSIYLPMDSCLRTHLKSIYNTIDGYFAVKTIDEETFNNIIELINLISPPSESDPAALEYQLFKFCSGLKDYHTDKHDIRGFTDKLLEFNRYLDHSAHLPIPDIIEKLRNYAKSNDYSNITTILNDPNDEDVAKLYRCHFILYCTFTNIDNNLAENLGNIFEIKAKESIGLHDQKSLDWKFYAAKIVSNQKNMQAIRNRLNSNGLLGAGAIIPPELASAIKSETNIQTIVEIYERLPATSLPNQQTDITQLKKIYNAITTAITNNPGKTAAILFNLLFVIAGATLLFIPATAPIGALLAGIGIKGYAAYGVTAASSLMISLVTTGIAACTNYLLQRKVAATTNTQKTPASTQRQRAPSLPIIPTQNTHQDPQTHARDVTKRRRAHSHSFFKPASPTAHKNVKPESPNP